MLGERWVFTNATNVNTSRNGQANAFDPSFNPANQSSGVSRSEMKRLFVEPSTFTTLRRGGELHNYQVECLVYKGGHLFPGDSKSGPLPYLLLTLDQR